MMGSLLVMVGVAPLLGVGIGSSPVLANRCVASGDQSGDWALVGR